MKEIEIPFGANDSELKGWEYTIPEGMEAEIKDGKIVVRKKESEDERVINQLITLVNSTGEVLLIPTNKEELIAWLEKQKESLHISETCKENDISFTDEDEMIRNGLISYFEIIAGDYFGEFKKSDIIAYLEKQKEPENTSTSVMAPSCWEVEQKEQKPNVEICPHSIKSKSYKENGYPIEDCVQKPAEWNEEETKDLVHILKVLDDCYIYGKHDLSKTDYDNLTSTLKSLRPSWKPSKEQMDALAKAVTFFKTKWTGAKVKEQLALESLFGDLERLI